MSFVGLGSVRIVFTFWMNYVLDTQRKTFEMYVLLGLMFGATTFPDYVKKYINI